MYKTLNKKGFLSFFLISNIPVLLNDFVLFYILYFLAASCVILYDCILNKMQYKYKHNNFIFI